jgi:predicted Zn-dependent protease
MGRDTMARAGFDPRESIALWRSMAAGAGAGPPEFLSTHPSSATRMRDLEAGMPQALQLFEAARAQGRYPRCA